MNTLNNIINHFYREQQKLAKIAQKYSETQSLNGPNKSKKINACLLSLQEALTRKGLPISVMMYGSAACGFGTVISDLDFSVLVSPNYVLKSEKAILKKIVELLLECDGNCKATFIDARIPIITAFYKGSSIVYNAVEAVEDAKLFKAYGNWDQRLFIVVFFVKKEFYKKGTPPWRYYKTDVIPEWSTNTSTPAELFLQFLEYYGSLDFSRKVIFIGDSTEHPCTDDEPVCIRSPFYCGPDAYKRFSREEKQYYRDHYGSPHEQNIASYVTRKGLNKSQKQMKNSAQQIRGYLQGNPMTCSTLGIYTLIKSKIVTFSPRLPGESGKPPSQPSLAMTYQFGNRQNLTQAESRMNTLNNGINHFYQTQTLQDPIKSERVKSCLVTLREAFIRKGLPLSLTMNYGSAACGFGSIHSDLDVTIKLSQYYELKDPRDILRKVAQVLLECDGNCKAEFVDARVPIVTTLFKGFDMDICYDGLDAVEDAKLFKAYGNWDPRVFPLGFIVKKWGKQLGICGGTTGYFRSFQWIILVINFLQKNRVVPYIQSEFSGISSADWRYYRTQIIGNWSTNKKTVGELFLDFLEYYGKLNFKTEVIYIRSSTPSSRNSDEISKPVCIRHPFYCDPAFYNRLSIQQREDYRKNGPEQALNVAGEMKQEKVDIIQEQMRRSAMQIRAYLQGQPLDSNLREIFGQ